jgi:hypothetical protein
MVDYAVYCADVPGSEALRHELGEAHWAYMDDFAERMTARGPTFDDEGRVTGSLHIVDLPSLADAEAFARAEPNYQAGVYAGVQIWPWRNELGRTMWDFPRDRHDGPHHLVIGTGRPDAVGIGGALAEAHDDFLRRNADRLVIYGSLVADDGGGWAGSLLALDGPSRTAVDALLAEHPYVGAGLYQDLQVHVWHFGGRR